MVLPLSELLCEIGGESADIRSLPIEATSPLYREVKGRYPFSGIDLCFFKEVQVSRTDSLL
jgi:hypothetical protein